MEGEQQIFAKDFLGLNTNCGRIAVDRNGSSEPSNGEKMNRDTAVLALEAANRGCPRREGVLFHGLDPSFRGSPRPVRNIYSQNMVGTFPNGDSPLENLSQVPREERQVVERGIRFLSLNDKEKVKTGGKPYEGLLDTDSRDLTKEECRRSVQQRGIRNSAQYKPVTLQQAMPAKPVCEDKPNERRAQNWASPIFHFAERQDVIDPNNRNSSCSQGRPIAVPLVTHGEPHPVDPAMVSPNSRLYFALSKPGLTTYFGSVAGGNQQVTKHIGSESSSAPFLTFPAISASKAGFQESPLTSTPLGEPPRAQLTVFYRGAVNVFDDVSMGKAKEIMLLASNASSLLANVRSPLVEECPLKTSPIFMNSDGIPTSASSFSQRPPSPKQVVYENIESINQAHFTSQHLARQFQENQGSPCIGNKMGTLRPSSSSINMMPDNQPNLTKALPQARKASLSRFLEKRKERMRSKNPYSIIKPSPEHTLMEMETISCPNYSALVSHPVSDFKEYGEENLMHMNGDIDEGLVSCDS